MKRDEAFRLNTLRFRRSVPKEARIADFLNKVNEEYGTVKPFLVAALSQFIDLVEAGGGSNVSLFLLTRARQLHPLDSGSAGATSGIHADGSIPYPVGDDGAGSSRTPAGSPISSSDDVEVGAAENDAGRGGPAGTVAGHDPSRDMGEVPAGRGPSDGGLSEVNGDGEGVPDRPSSPPQAVRPGPDVEGRAGADSRVSGDEFSGPDLGGSDQSFSGPSERVSGEVRGSQNDKILPRKSTLADRQGDF